jgi:hypothetical protein
MRCSLHPWANCVTGGFPTHFHRHLKIQVNAQPEGFRAVLFSVTFVSCFSASISQFSYILRHVLVLLLIVNYPLLACSTVFRPSRNMLNVFIRIAAEAFLNTLAYFGSSKCLSSWLPQRPGCARQALLSSNPANVDLGQRRYGRCSPDTSSVPNCGLCCRSMRAQLSVVRGRSQAVITSWFA